MLTKGERVTVGLSGGADSVALTHALHTLGYEVRAVHVNHMIRGAEADADQRFVHDFCAALGIPLTELRLDIPSLARKEGLGLEECGRKYRYLSFSQAAQGGKIATAHTLSDSAETVLMNMARGCSVSGLCGIPPVRGNIIRPLIGLTRADIERYCRENGLSFVTDSTNLDPSYTRNRVRLKIIPELTAINPSFLEAVGRLGRCASADERYLSERAAEEKERCASLVSKLSLLDDAILSRLLASVCEEATGRTPEHRHVEALMRVVRRGGTVQLPGNYDGCVRSGRLTFIKRRLPEPEEVCLPFALGDTLLPNGKKLTAQVIGEKIPANVNKLLTKNLLDYDKILSILSEDGKLFLRTRREGDRFSPAGRGLTKSVKKLMSESAVPLERRPKLLMLVSGEKILWIEGFGAAEGFAADQDTPTILKISLRTDENTL